MTENINKLLSKDATQIIQAASDINHQSQNEKYIKTLVPYLDEIIESTCDIDLGGLLAPNKRFLNYSINIIKFYKNNSGCSCTLYNNDCDPKRYIKQGYLNLLETIKISDSLFIDYYLVQCTKCNQRYKVTEREGHMIFYEYYIYEN